MSPHFVTQVHFTEASQQHPNIGAGQCMTHLLWHCPTTPRYSPLHAACYLGEAMAVQLLLAAGAAPGSVADDGYTPMHAAASQVGLGLCMGNLCMHVTHTSLHQ